ERRADRDDPVADLHLVGVAEPDRRELALAVVQPEHGEVGLLVETDDLRLVLAPVERDDLDLGGALHHVGVRQRDAAGVDDDARAEAALGNPFRRFAEEPAVELLPEKFLEPRATPPPTPGNPA